MFLTAIFLTFGLLTLAGCRRSTPPMPGWVRLVALDALHPDTAMDADLLHRLQELQAQRTRILAHPAPALPPALLATPAPDSISALPAPPPAPSFNRQTGRLHDALQEAGARRLNNQQQADTLDFLRDREQAYEKDLDDALAAAEKQYEQKRQRIEQEHVLSLEKVQMSLDIAKYNLSLHPTWKILQAKLATANQNVQAMVDAEKAALDAAAADYTAENSHLRVEKEQALKADIAHEQETLQAVYAEKSRQLAVEIAAQLAADTDTPLPPAPLDFTPFTLTTPSRDISTLPPQALASALRIAGERQRAVREIDQTMATLQQQRRDLHVRLAAETRAAVEAVAAQHGYQVRFIPSPGQDITAQARVWLQEYWQGLKE